MMQPTRKRTASQTNLRDVFGQFIGKQQPRHHRPTVRQHQFRRIMNIHGTLNGRRAKMQRANVAQL